MSLLICAVTIVEPDSLAQSGSIAITLDPLAER